MFEAIVSQLNEGVRKNKLSDRYYNKGVPSLIVLLLILYTSYLSISQFSVDATGLTTLIGIIFLGLFVVLSFASPGIKADARLGSSAFYEYVVFWWFWRF